MSEKLERTYVVSRCKHNSREFLLHNALLLPCKVLSGRLAQGKRKQHEIVLYIAKTKQQQLKQLDKLSSHDGSPQLLSREKAAALGLTFNAAKLLTIIIVKLAKPFIHD